MNKVILFALLLSFLLVPKMVLANMIVPLAMITIPLLVIIIPVEAFVFWFLANKVLKIKTGFWKLILVVFVANIVTSFFGIFVPLMYRTETLMKIGALFIASILIEWGLYIPFFMKSKIKISDLLKISFVVNAATYIPIFVYIALS